MGLGNLSEVGFHKPKGERLGTQPSQLSPSPEGDPGGMTGLVASPAFPLLPTGSREGGTVKPGGPHPAVQAAHLRLDT